jgi:cytochrome c oxidase assembly factor CtaG
MTTADLLRSSWTLRPVVLLACAAAIAWHASTGGLRAGRRTAALLAAVAILLLALSSPIDALAAGYLFSAHMLQHLLLVLVVPALALMALPPPAFAHGGRAGRAFEAASRWLLRRPVVTWGSGIGAMWLWHAQTLCNAASQSGAVRGLQSVSLLAMGAVFYWPLLAPRRPSRMSPLAGMVYLFTACIGCTLLGILITLSPVEVCPAFLHPQDGLGVLPLIRDRWGLSAAEDQQIGGLLMWVPACAVYLGGIVAQLGRFYRADEEGAR